ncbi:hypothetical protein NADFUDRAFT_52370 [Nadsonia fulvescens var. elongata DSM 6958]|uniref:DUF2423 domain-containing protein n=1 Tax=Nadsonia fulvescens var. elongata DSM 6958 TaxID=857566 RepID=A0A1E3PIR7_9ASCO|nr:hypothetical protein NADFUDRAFT_52370 [Nadsonia fulvescens var. elongata DSM 6958]
MGKSLRSKQKLRMRGIKRKNITGPHEHDRAVRLAEHAKERLEEQIKSDEQAKDVSEDKDESMDVDAEKKKVDTHGWKGSGHEAWRHKKADKVKKRKSAIVFHKKGGKKNKK